MLLNFPISTLGWTDTLYDAIGFKVGKVLFNSFSGNPIFLARATALNSPFSESKAMILSLLFVGFSPPFAIFSLLISFFHTLAYVIMLLFVNWGY